MKRDDRVNDISKMMDRIRRMIVISIHRSSLVCRNIINLRNILHHAATVAYKRQLSALLVR